MNGQSLEYLKEFLDQFDMNKYFPYYIGKYIKNNEVCTVLQI